jgi:hypothetical protein
VFIVVRLQCLRTARELVTESLVAGMAPMCHLEILAELFPAPSEKRPLRVHKTERVLKEQAALHAFVPPQKAKLHNTVVFTN